MLTDMQKLMLLEKRLMIKAVYLLLLMTNVSGKRNMSEFKVVERRYKLGKQWLLLNVTENTKDGEFYLEVCAPYGTNECSKTILADHTLKCLKAGKSQLLCPLQALAYVNDNFKIRLKVFASNHTRNYYMKCDCKLINIEIYQWNCTEVLKARTFEVAQLGSIAAVTFSYHDKVSNYIRSSLKVSIIAKEAGIALGRPVKTCTTLPTNTCFISNLHPCKNYTICLKAVNSICGGSNESLRCQNITFRRLCNMVLKRSHVSLEDLSKHTKNVTIVNRRKTEKLRALDVASIILSVFLLFLLFSTVWYCCKCNHQQENMSLCSYCLRRFKRTCTSNCRQEKDDPAQLTDLFDCRANTSQLCSDSTDQHTLIIRPE